MCVLFRSHKLELRCCRTRFRPGRSRRQPESDAHSATISNHRPNPAQHDTRDLAVVPGAMVARSMIGSFTEMAPSISTRWVPRPRIQKRSEEHTSELQSLMRISYAVFCLK